MLKDQSFTERAIQFATGRVVVAALLVAVLFAAWLFNAGPYPELQALSAGPLLEERFGYDAVSGAAFLDSLGASGRSDYVGFQAYDTVNALLVMGALTLLMAWCLGRMTSPGQGLRRLVWLPGVAFVAECIENALLMVVALGHPEAAETIWTTASLATQFKLLTGFAAIPASALSVVALAVITLWRRIRPGD